MRSRFSLSRLTALLLAAGSLVPFSARAQVSLSDSTRWGAPASRFVTTISSGNYAAAAALAAPALRGSVITAAALQQLWGNVVAQMGALRTISLQRVQSRDSLHAVDLDASFERASITIRVTLDDSANVLGMSFQAAAQPSAPPPYADSSLFTEVTVTFGADPWSLQGTLTLPRDGARAPVVVLVHGSGPNDRDETLGPNKPFRDIAWGLASRGIAVFRYDKRTFVHSARIDALRVTLEEEVIDDALAAVAAMRKQGGVDSSRIFVLGHSLGGMLLPDISKRDGRLAGIILAAAPARPFVDVLADQLAYLDSLSRTGGDTVNAPLRALRAQVDSLRGRRVRDSALVMGVPAHYWYKLGELDPARVVREQPARVLVIQGGRDYQVTMRDYAIWEEALRGSPNATLRAFPSLNHLFMTGAGRATPSEYQTSAGHVSAEVITAIVEWVGGRGG